MSEKAKEVQEAKEVQQVQEAKEIQILDKSKSYAEIAEILCKQNKYHFVCANTILSAHAYKQATKDGKGFYTQLFLQLQNGVKYFKEGQDGNIYLTLLSVVQTSVYSVLNVLRKELFYTPILSRISQDFADDAEANPNQRDENNVYLTDEYFKGVPVVIFGQFVESGEVATNPFSNNAEPYEVKDSPRYIYHIINVGKPTDEEALADISAIKRQVAAENRALREARKTAKLQSVSVLSRIETTEEVPF